VVPPSDLHELLIRSVVDYAIFMLDPEGRVVSWSPGAERIKGYAADEIIGEHFSRFYTDEDRTAGIPKAALAQAAETGRFTTEAWRVRKDGSRFWAMVVIDPIRQDGKLIGFAKITRDMTESCAMPPVRCSIASIFCDCISCSCDFSNSSCVWRRSVRSRVILAKPRSWPSVSRMASITALAQN
jgi:PAS domain S-box-containing protein